tara:strand:- start:202 stop:393 length:192 start_codon:yes stop_codon:yes gene_type:complete
MASIDELKKSVALWQKVEDEGGSPTSAKKLKAAKNELNEAEKEEPVVDDWNEDDAIAQADEEE